MANSPRPLRILWAVDPSETSVQFYQTVPQVIRYFLRQPGTKVQPVTVLSVAPDAYEEVSAGLHPEYSAFARRHISELTRELKLRELEPLRVLYHDSLSTRGAVDTLTEQAARWGADLILAQSHSRKGVKRLFLGSFAETLLLRSKIPVMLLSPRMKPFNGFRRLLFPTDFGRSARVQMRRVIDLALTFRARVTLFHSVQHPIEPVGTGFFPVGPLGPFPEYVQSRIRSARRRAHAWSRFAASQGVSMDVVIDERGVGIWEEILRISGRLKIDLITMQAKSGPVAAALLGSTIRQVVRHSPCPVWVLKPGEAREKRLLRRASPENTRKMAA